MKKNENIFISLQLQKDMESKKLLLSVHFDKNARNFSIKNETIVWCPTCDEIDFIAEVSKLIEGVKYREKVIQTPQISIASSEEVANDYLHDSSETRITPIENDEKIFFQTDEKKIDEILNRKKQVLKEDYVIKSGEKIFIDQMLKQKKKK